MKRGLICCLALIVLLSALPVYAGAEEGTRFSFGEQSVSSLYADAPDSDRLLESYIAYLRGGSGRGEVQNAVSAGSRLQGVDAAAYRVLRPLIEDVAAGQRASTVFTLLYRDLGIPSVLTAGELGLTCVAEEDDGMLAFTDQARQAVSARIFPNTDRLIGALLADCPYALYWFDKTSPFNIGTGSFSYDEFNVYFEEDAAIVLSLPVAAAYSAGAYTFDVTVSASIQAAVTRAEGIVAQYASLSDYDKLDSYRRAICGLTEYEYDALGDDVPYGDPWQLIWVFDGDESTNVVCEGYSKAFQYLCDLTSFNDNVTCMSVTGAMNGGAHMWNLVRMPNAKVYLVDVTNCDAGMIGADRLLFLAGAYAGNPDDGYTVRCEFDEENYADILYTYDENARIVFSNTQLTVSSVSYLDDDQTIVDAGDGDDGSWEYVLDGVGCTITRYVGDGGEVLVPHAIKGYPVTAIGDSAFSGCTNVTGVVMRDGTISIGNNAFEECTNLTHVTVPASVVNWGLHCFYHCVSLADVTLCEGLTSLGESVFNQCFALGQIVLPESLTTIGSAAFYYCNSLQSITIPANVREIDGSFFNLFYGCTSLSAIDVDPANAVYSSIDGVLFDRTGSTLICCPPGRNGIYSIPSGVRTIETAAFYGCAQLTQIAIPEGVQMIGVDVFLDCTALTGIAIPASVTVIGGIAAGSMLYDYGNIFSGCTALTYIDVDRDNECFYSADGVLYSVNGPALLAYPAGAAAASFDIPQGAETIGLSAFYGAANLASVGIPDSVTTLSYMAFAYCEGLENLNVPESVTKIGNSAFYFCTALESITIPDSVTEIGNYVLNGCDALSAIYCSASSYAFEWAVQNGYGALVVTGEAISEGPWQALPDGHGGCVITQYTGNTQALTVPSSVADYTVTAIAGGVFEGHSELVSVILPPSVTAIGEGAFRNCSALTDVTLPEGLTVISESLFNWCTSLVSIDLPQGLTRIGGWSFQGCSSLASIELPDTVTEIGNCAFHTCSALAYINLPEGLTLIPSDVFSMCMALEEIVLPGSVTEIGNYAFDHCESLRSIVVPAGVISIENNILDGCSDELVFYCERNSFAARWARDNGLTHIVYFDEAFSEPVYVWASDNGSVTATRANLFLDGVTETETVTTVRNVSKSPTETQAGETTYVAEFTNAAFGRAIKTVTDIPPLSQMDVLRLPAELDGIGEKAFAASLCQAVLIPDGCRVIGSMAFADCADLYYVKIPASVTFIAPDAFEGCPLVRIDRAAGE